jgi:cytochrome c5
MLRPHALFLALSAALVLFACGDDSAPPADAGFFDGGVCPTFEEPITEPTTDTWDNYAEDFFATYCTRCHSSTLATNTERSGAPAGLNWDVEASVGTHAMRVRDALRRREMPPSGLLPPCEDRFRIVRWIDNGRP